MIRVIINGAAGAMGRVLAGVIEKDDVLETVGRVDFTGNDGTLKSLAEFEGEADIVIDFSNHLGTRTLMDYCIANNLPVIVCTTGQTEEEMDMIREASTQIPVFKSGNMSVGVAILTKLVREVAEKFNGEVEIIEMHHNRKLDAPSGTALMLAEAAQEARPGSVSKCGRSGAEKRQPNDIGIQSVRMGNIVGIHEVMIGTNTQTITLKHEAHDRALFADGAVDAAKFLVGTPAGFYNMDNLLAD